MKEHFHFPKIVEAFVFAGCSAMLLIQIGNSLNEYLAFRTVATLHVETLDDIVLPNIVICQEKSYNIQLSELMHGIREETKTDEDYKIVGWGEEL